MYDPTIDGLPEENEKFHFNKIGIAGEDSIKDNMLSMQTILEGNGHLSYKNMILKMDVEGAEWDFINHTSSEIIDNFSQITLELHSMTDESKFNEIMDALQRLNATHQIVWVHEIIMHLQKKQEIF